MSNCCGSLGVDYEVGFNPSAQPSTVDNAQSHAQDVLGGSIKTPQVDERNENNNSSSFGYSVNLPKSGDYPSSTAIPSSSLEHHQNLKEMQRHGPQTSGSVDYYQVVVRLKPKLKRAPGVYLAYDITSPETASGGEKVTMEAPNSSTLSFSPLQTTTPQTAHIMCHSDCSNSLRDQATGGFIHTAQTGDVQATGETPSRTIISITEPSIEGDECGRYTCRFEFNDVIGPNTSDMDMCAKVVPRILEQLNADYNVCVLCYGQIGSGKTHTANVLSQALIKAVFGSIVSTDVVELSFIQIYGNKGYNLLAKSSEEDLLGIPLPKPRGTVVFEPKYIVKNELDAENRRRAAQMYRYTSTHALNARSSRSHTLFSLHITKYRDGVPLSTAKVTLVDLAGSERVEEIGAAGKGLDEATAMNKSLSMLRSYIVLGANANDPKSYGDSLLMTYLMPRLQDWHVLLIVTASLGKNNFEMTKKSLEFATASKRRVVEKRKCGLEERLSFSGFNEQAFTDFNEVITTLHNRTCALEEDLRLEWGRHDRQERLSSPQLPEHMERRIEVSQSLLRDDDKELRMLNRGGQPHHTDCCRSEIQEPSSEHSEGLLRDKQSNSAVMKGVLDRLKDLFLWLFAHLDELREQRDVLEKTIEDLRTENSRLVAEVERCACEVNQRNERVAKLGSKQQSMMEERDLLRDKIEQLHLESFLGYVDRTVRCEMEDLFKYTTEARRIDDISFSRSDLKAAESASTADQAYLSIQRELEASEKKYEKLKEEWDICLALNKLMWKSCTPQQKMYISSAKTMDAAPYADGGTPSRFLFGGDDSCLIDDNVSSGDVHTAPDYQSGLSFGMESIKLRCIVRDLRATLEETIYERTKASEESHAFALENERLRQRLQEEVEKNMCYDKEMRQMMHSMRLLQQQVESSNAYFAGQKNKYADLAAALDRSDEENKRLSLENEKLKAEVRLLKKQNEAAYRCSNEHESFRMYGSLNALQRHFAVPPINTLNNGNHGVVGAPPTAGPSVVAQGALHEASTGRAPRKTIVPGRRLLARSKSASRKHRLPVERPCFTRLNSEGNNYGGTSLHCKPGSKPAPLHP
ncbi:unnamed protein product [Phytomonas sp. EM1]|nr:unnamed protein product [Phytomonas sp. EM1]|eukprot:CCW64915.1 unnamed protein product [Phytomonas sp. isolate EM1]